MPKTATFQCGNPAPASACSTGFFTKSRLQTRLARHGAAHHEEHRWARHKLKPYVDALPLTPTAHRRPTLAVYGWTDSQTSPLLRLPYAQTFKLAIHTQAADRCIPVSGLAAAPDAPLLN